MNNIFSTFDLGLATILFTLRYELIELDRSNPKKIRFVFERTEDIEKAIANYWDDKIELPAQTLLNNYKTLKNRIYSDA